MFERRSRQPFPVRNIIALSLVVLLVLLFLLYQLKKAEREQGNQPLLIEQGH